MRVVVPHQPVLVPLSADDLTDVVDVLIDNVFDHTPDGTAFSVTLTTDAGRARLVVADEGPGLRPSGTAPRRGSTGLGLDIVRRTAASVGGGLTLGPATRGPVRVATGAAGSGAQDAAAAGTRVEVSLPLVER